MKRAAEELRLVEDGLIVLLLEAGLLLSEAAGEGSGSGAVFVDEGGPEGAALKSTPLVTPPKRPFDSH